MQESDGMLTKVLLALGGVLAAVLGFFAKVFLERRKLNAEAQNISITSDKTAHDMHQSDAREYREMFKQAENAIRKSRREWMKAEFFIRGMLFKMKQHNVPGVEEDEREFQKLIAEID